MSSDEGYYSKKQLREIVLWSPTQIDREEKAGKFPKRVRLGPYRTSRVGWPKREVHAWCREREQARQRDS
jgi:prophage regulatory protein